jgi:hypothetical protein
VRINAVVHLRTHLPEKSLVPIGWVAVGNPARILPPDRHEEIWDMQQPLNFPLTVHGLDRSESNMVRMTRKLSDKLSSHAEDTTIS